MKVILMKVILFATFVFLFLVFSPSNAYACSCGEVTQQEEFERAESVFIGKFTKRLENGRVELKITKSWKGVKAGEIISLFLVDIIGCDYDIKLVRNKKYLIYAVRSVSFSEGLFISLDCGRSRATKHAKEDIKNMDKVASQQNQKQT